MGPMQTPHVKNFGQALELWTDERFVTREQVYDLSVFALYLVNLAEAAGWVYRGHSYKENGGMNILTVRGDLDDIPHVVFTSGRSYTACVHIFLRKLHEGWLEWVVDRYR